MLLTPTSTDLSLSPGRSLLEEPAEGIVDCAGAASRRYTASVRGLSTDGATASIELSAELEPEPTRPIVRAAGSGPSALAVNPPGITRISPIGGRSADGTWRMARSSSQ